MNDTQEVEVLDHSQQQRDDRQRMEEDIADAWANIEHDISYAKHAMWTSEDDIKLLKWALGL